MTKKDFVVIADSLRHSRQLLLRNEHNKTLSDEDKFQIIVNVFTTKLSGLNPKFNPDTFKKEIYKE